MNILLLVFLIKTTYSDIPIQKACTQKTCNNGGHFINDKCLCECYPNYSGDVCQNILCDVNPPLLCLDLSTKECLNSVALYHFCPLLCGKCSQNTTSTHQAITTLSPTTIIQKPSCMYGQIFDITTSTCKCLTGFSGKLCEYFDCDSNFKDAEECILLDCSIPIEVGSCPRQCSATCLIKSTQTTTISTTAKTSPGIYDALNKFD